MAMPAYCINGFPLLNREQNQPGEEFFSRLIVSPFGDKTPGGDLVGGLLRDLYSLQKPVFERAYFCGVLAGDNDADNHHPQQDPLAETAEEIVRMAGKEQQEIQCGCAKACDKQPVHSPVEFLFLFVAVIGCF